MWQLMTAHSEVVLGFERYLRVQNKLLPPLFESGHFFDTKHGTEELKEYFSSAQKRFERATFVGDKIPALYMHYDKIEANFPNAEIIFLLRNIIDVATSYEARRKDANDHWQRDYRRAVKEWGQSINSTRRFRAKKSDRVRIHVVSYEELWLEPVDLAPLFTGLGLSSEPEVQDRYNHLIGLSKEIQSRRLNGLDSGSRNYVALNAAFGPYRSLFEQRVRLTPVAQSSGDAVASES
jgi:Sulfotransferase family